MATMSRKPARRWGVIGLGAGSMAAYTDSGSTMTFFEIDPDIEFVARRYFTFLSRCGTQCRVVVGDGRLELEKLPEGQLDLLMLDAFSSDAIPAHLLSREAIQLYLSRLAPDGVILFHVSNRYLDVPTVVSSLIQDAALVGLIKRDPGGTFDQDGRAASIHVVAARKAEDLGDLTRLPGWEAVRAPRGFRVWTDDYSNLMGIVNFR